MFKGRTKKTSNSASLALVSGRYRWLVDSPHKGPVTRKMFPFDDVIMTYMFQRIESPSPIPIHLYNHIEVRINLIRSYVYIHILHRILWMNWLSSTAKQLNQECTFCSRGFSLIPNFLRYLPLIYLTKKGKCWKSKLHMFSKIIFHKKCSD